MYKYIGMHTNTGAGERSHRYTLAQQQIVTYILD